MPWNEPGNPDEKNKKDPWTGKPKSNTPPDLESLIRDFRKKLVQAFAKKNGDQNDNQNKDSKNTSDPMKIGGLGLGTIALFVILAWFLWGIFIVGPAEKAIVLRFGKYVNTVGPGPHWIPRLIENAYVVNEQRISNYSYNAEMLTKDQNIVSVAIAVQYRIGDARAFLFNVVSPVESLQQATASSLRQVIGKTNLDEVLTSGRAQVAKAVKDQLTAILAKYQTGLLITDVAMQPAKAPDEVKEAFDDAIKAQEDEQRFENQAQAYAMQVVPIAKGQAQRLLADASGYKQQVVLRAQGEIASFNALLPEYIKAPEVTKERLYLETLQNIFAHNNKVLVDTAGNNNMFYVPLEKLLKEVEKPADTTIVTPPAATAATASTDTTQSSYGSDTSTNPAQGGY